MRLSSWVTLCRYSILFTFLCQSFVYAAPTSDLQILGFQHGWRSLGLPKQAKNQFIALSNNHVQLHSKASVSFHYQPLLSAKQLKQHRWQLSWEWRVLEASPAVATNTNDRDDRPLALHLWLNEPRSAGWFKGKIANALGIPTPGRMLTYSWGGTEPLGSSFNNPHLDHGKGVITIQRGQQDIGQGWFKESIIINQALLDAFGELPQQRVFIVISADTEDRAGYAFAELRSISLRQLPEA